jgi:hypothetical protein
MYDITKTRMLLTTAVFASVAAVFTSGANARIPDEDGSGIGAEPVAVVAATVDPLASSRLTGLLRAAQTRDRESGALSGANAAPARTQGVTTPIRKNVLSSLTSQERRYLKSMTAVCSVVLCQPDEWLAARLGFATRAGSAPTYKFPECSVALCQPDELLAARRGSSMSIMSLTPAQLAANALGTGYALPTKQAGPTVDSVLASMSPETRRYTEAVMDLTFEQLAAGAAGHP